MQNANDTIFARGLAFFGRTNRLISHELKNVLAIISETTSLMDELIELSDEGTRLDPGKLRSLARSILEDIDRANGIIRSMNTFAHGVDSWYAEAEVGRTLNVMQTIARMNASAKKARLVFPDSEPCIIFTIPFVLQNLLYEILTGILTSAPSDVRVTLKGEQERVTIRIEGADSEFSQHFIRERAPFFEKTLTAAIQYDLTAKAMTLTLPRRIEDRGNE